MSAFIRKAAKGDAPSLAALVERFTPALLLQASYRITPRLRRFVDPQDVVNDVWLGALGRLSSFDPQQGRAVPTLLAYLGVAVMRRVYHLDSKHLKGKPTVIGNAGRDGDPSFDPVADLPAETTGVVSRAVRSERWDALRGAIAELEETDRAVVVLRAIEQQPAEIVAGLTGLSPNAVAQRLRRALEKLRKLLPQSIFDDLVES